MKKNFRIFILVLAMCMTFSIFSINAMAATSDGKYVDANTAVKLYSDLYAKYYPNEVTVSVDKGTYKPVLATELNSNLAALEKYLKVASSPENCIKVDYDNNGKIIGLMYPVRYKAQAQKYITAMQKQRSAEALANVTINPIPNATSKSTRKNILWQVTDIPWGGATYGAGYNATFYTSYEVGHVPTAWFNRTASNITGYTVYSGNGDAETSVSGISQALTDMYSTDNISLTINCHAWVTNSEGILITFRNSYFRSYDWRANTFY